MIGPHVRVRAALEAWAKNRPAMPLDVLEGLIVLMTEVAFDYGQDVENEARDAFKRVIKVSSVSEESVLDYGKRIRHAAEDFLAEQGVPSTVLLQLSNHLRGVKL